MATESQQHNNQNGIPQRIATGLGWFSVGLGIAELVAPKTLANFIGLEDNSSTKKVMRAYGVRELAAGIGILAGSNSSKWLWARVAGDALDLSSLGKAMASGGTERGKTSAATAAVIGVTALDIYCAQQLSRSEANGSDAQAKSEVARSIIIDRSPEEIYGFWRDFSRLPQIFSRLESVETTGGNRSHWKLRIPAGRTIEWDAETTEDRPNSRIAWRSFNSTAQHSGSVTFERATGGRGTKVTVEMQLGTLGKPLGKMLSMVPAEQVQIALHNLKQILETGEVIQSDASIYDGPHPAQPPENYQNQTRSKQATA